MFCNITWNYIEWLSDTAKLLLRYIKQQWHAKYTAIIYGY